MLLFHLIFINVYLFHLSRLTVLMERPYQFILYFDALDQLKSFLQSYLILLIFFSLILSAFYLTAALNTFFGIATIFKYPLS